MMRAHVNGKSFSLCLIFALSTLIELPVHGFPSRIKHASQLHKLTPILTKQVEQVHTRRRMEHPYLNSILFSNLDLDLDLENEATKPIPSTASNGPKPDSQLQSRRHILKSTAAASSFFMLNLKVNPARALDESPPGNSVNLFETKSGLKYIDLKPGTGPSPKYGQLCSISYKAALKLPSTAQKPTKPETFDSDSAFLLKHGNGRTIPGLDEGIHTMKVGGVRRLIIPPKLGYVANGLGPIPGSPLDRRKLNKLLDEMVKQRSGQLIFDVELRSAIDDEADQGYYSDSSLSPEDFETLRDNIQRAGREAKEKKLQATSTQI